MNKLLAAAILSIFAFTAWECNGHSFPSQAQAASVNDKCYPNMSVSEFSQLQIDSFGKQGQQIELVPMTGDALKKFVAVLKKSFESKGYQAQAFDTEWDLILWAKFKNPQGQDVIGIAAFYDGCLKEADVWSIDVFYGYIKEAFGVDA